MKRFICILGTIASIMLVCLCVNMICNEKMLKQYQQGSYTENKLETGELTKEQVSTNLSIIKEAKEVLTIHDCATADHKGHSKVAQTLYDELSELEEELKELNGSGSSNSDPKDTKEEDDQTPDQKKEEQIKELQKKSTASRKEELQLQELTDNYDYYEGASW